MVPYTPGSGPDITSRLMADQINKMHGVNVVVENRPGAGTVLGTEAAARAAPDGTTVVMVANSFVINPAVGRGNYTVQGSFEPVCQLAATPMVLVVQSSSSMKTLKDLVDEAKAGKIVFASGGPASSLHIAIEVLKIGAEARLQLRALRRHRAGDQCAARRPCAGGLGRLPDGGQPDQGRHAARARHHLAGPDRRNSPASRR